jgi:hypothetical protein
MARISAPLACLVFTVEMWQNDKAQIVMIKLFGRPRSAPDWTTLAVAMLEKDRKALIEKAL